MNLDNSLPVPVSATPVNFTLTLGEATNAQATNLHFEKKMCQLDKKILFTLPNELQDTGRKKEFCTAKIRIPLSSDRLDVHSRPRLFSKEDAPQLTSLAAHFWHTDS